MFSSLNTKLTHPLFGVKLSLVPPPLLSSDLSRGMSTPDRFASAAANNQNGIRELLFKKMIRAKRNGMWFGLPRRERGLFELAMRLKVKLQSFDLLRALVSVLKDLKETCDRGGMAFVKAARLVRAISEAAASWGNAQAREWRNDLNYIRFLAIDVKYW